MAMFSNYKHAKQWFNEQETEIYSIETLVDVEYWVRNADQSDLAFHQNLANQCVCLMQSDLFVKLTKLTGDGD